MIESIFLWIMSAGFILLILGIELDNLVYSMISTLMWIIVLASHFYIIVPSTTASYWEVSLFPLSLGMILINLISTITTYYQIVQNRKYHIR